MIKFLAIPVMLILVVHTASAMTQPQPHQKPLEIKKENSAFKGSELGVEKKKKIIRKLLVGATSILTFGTVALSNTAPANAALEVGGYCIGFGCNSEDWVPVVGGKEDLHNWNRGGDALQNEYDKAAKNLDEHLSIGIQSAYEICSEVGYDTCTDTRFIYAYQKARLLHNTTNAFYIYKNIYSAPSLQSTCDVLLSNDLLYLEYAESIGIKITPNEVRMLKEIWSYSIGSDVALDVCKVIF